MLGIGPLEGPDPCCAAVWGGVYGTISPVRLGVDELGIVVSGVGDGGFYTIVPVSSVAWTGLTDNA